MAANGYAVWVGRDRIERAWRMFTSRADHHIVRVLPRTGEYIVRSQRYGARGLTYRVNPARHTCTCVDYRSHGGAVTCKHLRLVDLLQRRGRALRPRRTLLGNAVCATLPPRAVPYPGTACTATAAPMAEAWFVRALTSRHAFVVDGHTGAPACGHAHGEDVLRTWHTDGSASLYGAPCPACAMNAHIGAGAGDIVMDDAMAAAAAAAAASIRDNETHDAFTESEVRAMLVRGSKAWHAAREREEVGVRLRFAKYPAKKLFDVLRDVGVMMSKYGKNLAGYIDAVIAQVFGDGMVMHPPKGGKRAHSEPGGAAAAAAAAGTDIAIDDDAAADGILTGGGRMFTEPELRAMLVRDSKAWSAARHNGIDEFRERIYKYGAKRLGDALRGAGAAMSNYTKEDTREAAVIAQVFGDGMVLSTRKRPGSGAAAGGAAGAAAADPKRSRPRAAAPPKAAAAGTGGEVDDTSAASTEISTAPTTRFRKLLKRGKPRMNFVVYGRDRCRQPLISDIGVATLASYQRVAAWAATFEIKAPQSMLMYHPTGAGKTVTLWSMLGALWKKHEPRFQKSFLFVTNAKLASSRQPDQDAWAFYNAAGEGSYSKIRRVATATTAPAATEMWKKYLPAPSVKGGTRADEGAMNTRVISYAQLYNALLANNHHGRMLYGVALGDLADDRTMTPGKAEYKTMTISNKSGELNHATFPAYITDLEYTAKGKGVTTSIDPLRDAVVVIDEADMLFNEVGEIGSERAALIEHAIFRSYALSGTHAVRVILGTATPAHTSLKVSFRLLNLLVRHEHRALRVGDVGSAGSMRSAGAAAYTNPNVTIATMRGSEGTPFDTPSMYRYMNAVSDGMSVVELDEDIDRFPVRNRHTVLVQPTAVHAAAYDVFAEKRLGIRPSKKDANADDEAEARENRDFVLARAAGSSNTNANGDVASVGAAASTAERAVEIKLIALANGLRSHANMMPRRGTVNTAAFTPAFTPGHHDWDSAAFVDHIHPKATDAAATATATAAARAAVDPTAAPPPPAAHGRAPKVIALLERIRAIDHAAIAAATASGKALFLPKHAIVCDTPGGFGAPLVAAGLSAAGYGWRRFARLSGERGDNAVVFADYDTDGGTWAPAPAISDEASRLRASPYGAHGGTTFAVLDATLLDSVLDLEYKPTVKHPSLRRAYSSYTVNTKTAIMLSVAAALEARAPPMGADEKLRVTDLASAELSYAARTHIWQSAAEPRSRAAADLYIQRAIGKPAQKRASTLDAATKGLQTAKVAAEEAGEAATKATSDAAEAAAKAADEAAEAAEAADEAAEAAAEDAAEDASDASDAADEAAAAVVEADKAVVEWTAAVETARRVVHAGTPLSGLLATVLSVLAPGGDATAGRGGAAAAAAAAAAAPTLDTLVSLGIARWAPKLSGAHQNVVRRKLTRHFNDRQANGNGEFARIIVLGPDMATGTSLFEVEHLHLFDALEKVADGTEGRVATRHRIQYEGRGWRLCGHRLVRARDALAAPTTLNVYEYRLLAGRIAPADALAYVRADNRRPVKEVQEYELLRREASAAAKVSAKATAYIADTELTAAVLLAARSEEKLAIAAAKRARIAFELAETMFAATKAKSTLLSDDIKTFYLDDLVQVVRRDPIEQVYLSEIDRWMKRAAFDRARNKVTVHTGVHDLVYTGYVLKKSGTAVYRLGGGSRMLVNVAGDELDLKLGGDAESFAAASSAAAAAAAAAAGGARVVQNGTVTVLHELWAAGELMWDTNAGDWVGVADYEQEAIERDVVRDLGGQLDALIELGAEQRPADASAGVSVMTTAGTIAVVPAAAADAADGGGSAASAAAAAAAAAIVSDDDDDDDDGDVDVPDADDVADVRRRQTWRARAADEMEARRADADVGAWIDAASAGTRAAAKQSGVFLNVLAARDLWLASFAGEPRTKKGRNKKNEKVDVPVKPANIFGELADTWRINRANGNGVFDAAAYVTAALGESAAREAAAGKPENVLGRTLVLSSRLDTDTLRAELAEYHELWHFDRAVVLDTLSKRPLLLDETPTEYGNVIFGALAVRRDIRAWRELTGAVAHVYGDRVRNRKNVSMVLPDQLRIALARVLVADRVAFTEKFDAYKLAHAAAGVVRIDVDDDDDDDDAAAMPVRITMGEAFARFAVQAEGYVRQQGRRAPTKLYGTARIIVNSMNATRLSAADAPMHVSFEAFAGRMLDIVHAPRAGGGGAADDDIIDAVLVLVLDDILPKPATFDILFADPEVARTPLHQLHADMREDPALRGADGAATNAEVAYALRKTLGNWQRAAALVAAEMATSEFPTGLMVIRKPEGTDASPTAIANAYLLKPKRKLGPPRREPLMYRPVAGEAALTYLNLADANNSLSWPAIIGRWIAGGSVVFPVYRNVSAALGTADTYAVIVDAVRAVLVASAVGGVDVKRSDAARVAAVIHDQLEATSVAAAATGAGGQFEFEFDVQHIKRELDARVRVFFPPTADAGAGAGAEGTTVPRPRTWDSLTPEEANLFVLAIIKMEDAWDNNVKFARMVEDSVTGVHASSIMQHIGEPNSKGRDVTDANMKTTRAVAELMLKKHMPEVQSSKGDSEQPHVIALNTVVDDFAHLVEEMVEARDAPASVEVAALTVTTLLMWFIDTAGVKLPAHATGRSSRVFEDRTLAINSYALDLADTKHAAAKDAAASTVAALFAGQRETYVTGRIGALLSVRPESLDSIQLFRNALADLDKLLGASDVKNAATAQKLRGTVSSILDILLNIQQDNNGDDDIAKQLKERLFRMRTADADSAGATADDLVEDDSYSADADAGAGVVAGADDRVEDDADSDDAGNALWWQGLSLTLTIPGYLSRNAHPSPAAADVQNVGYIYQIAALASNVDRIVAAIYPSKPAVFTMTLPEKIDVGRALAMMFRAGAISWSAGRAELFRIAGEDNVVKKLLTNKHTVAQAIGAYYAFGDPAHFAEITPWDPPPTPRATAAALRDVSTKMHAQTAEFSVNLNMFVPAVYGLNGVSNAEFEAMFPRNEVDVERARARARDSVAAMMADIPQKLYMTVFVTQVYFNSSITDATLRDTAKTYNSSFDSEYQIWRYQFVVAVASALYPASDIDVFLHPFGVKRVRLAEGLRNESAGADAGAGGTDEDTHVPDV